MGGFQKVESNENTGPKLPRTFVKAGDIQANTALIGTYSHSYEKEHTNKKRGNKFKVMTHVITCDDNTEIAIDGNKDLNAKLTTLEKGNRVKITARGMRTFKNNRGEDVSGYSFWVEKLDANGVATPILRPSNSSQEDASLRQQA